MIIRINGIGAGNGFEFINALFDNGLFIEGLSQTRVTNRISDRPEWSLDVRVKPEAVEFLEKTQKQVQAYDTILSIEILERDHEPFAEAKKFEADKDYMTHVRATAKQVGEDVYQDIDHQVNKYGAQRVDAFGWLAILTEEFGETAQAYLKKNYGEAVAEAKQTIACLSRFITEVEREQMGLNLSEAEWYERAQ